MKFRWNTIITVLALACVCWLGCTEKIKAQSPDTGVTDAGQDAGEGENGDHDGGAGGDSTGDDGDNNGDNNGNDGDDGNNDAEKELVDVSGATLEKTEVRAYIVDWQAESIIVGFNNMPDLPEHTFEYTSSNDGMDVYCSFDAEKKALTINAWSKGTTVLTITINNTVFILNVIASEVNINKNSSLLVLKKKTTLKIRGYSGKVKWKTMNKKVASVSSAGVVKGKKIGSTIVYTEVGGHRLGCAVSVLTSKQKKVINAAKKIGKGTYSQPKRMLKGYYDCSALVWRAYKKIGKTFGDRSYAPVAANIARYLFKNKKRIKGGLNSKNINGMKLRPGDLAFGTGAKNGRYKGIYHVEMFVGYICMGFDSSGKPYIGTLWATKGVNAYYGWPMGRP